MSLAGSLLTTPPVPPPLRSHVPPPLQAAVESAAAKQLDRRAELATLFDALQASPHAFDFFALLRRIEALRTDAPRIGRALRVSQESLRLGQEPDLDFAPAALASFTTGRQSAPRLGVRFFGLLGSQGPMPLHLTEYVRERLRFRNDAAPARFLDIFHHRLLSLFYRAWAQAQPSAQHDRPDDDRFAAWLGACSGLGPASRASGHLPQNAKLYQPGLLSSRSRHAEGLTKLLAQYFGVPVRIESCVAHRLAVDAADRSRLGFARNRPLRAGTSSAALGRTATAGHWLHDRRSKFRIVLGPLTLGRYYAFLPGGTAWQALNDWVRQYVGLGLLWDVQLKLLKSDIPEPRLGRGVPLGVATWIGRSSPPRAHLAAFPLEAPCAPVADRDDLRLRPGTSFLLRQGGRHA